MRTADELRRKARLVRRNPLIDVINITPEQADAIAEVLDAAVRVIENDGHISFGIDPPGWRETHRVLHGALDHLNAEGVKA